MRSLGRNEFSNFPLFYFQEAEAYDNVNVYTDPEVDIKKFGDASLEPIMQVNTELQLCLLFILDDYWRHIPARGGGGNPPPP